MIDYKTIFKDKLVAQGDFPECYAFSLHKAGSSLMYAMLEAVCRLASIPGFSIPDTLFLKGIHEIEWENDEHILDLIAPGRIYYGFRQLPRFLLSESANLREKKSVLLVRDPRDALVSQFFSFGGKNISHKLPNYNKEDFLKKLHTTAHLDIDEYVLQAATDHIHKLNLYKENLNFNNVLLFKYEDVYYDKRKFIADIFAHFDIIVDPSLLDQVATENDVRPVVEDVTKHIRKGTPGDHRNKLMPETIVKLNAIFGETCKGFGYDLSE